jgi:NADH dehydrogenase (ubiquinone) 1 alpha subcomplex subunit 9
MLQDDSTAQQTYELYGPKNYSTAEIAELVDKEIIKHRRHINLPKAVLKPLAGILNSALWWPVISADEVEREFIDQKIDRNAKTFKDLGIEPAELSSLTFHYLVSALPLLLRMFPSNILAARIPKRCLLRPTSCYGT